MAVKVGRDRLEVWFITGYSEIGMRRGRTGRTRSWDGSRDDHSKRAAFLLGCLALQKRSDGPEMIGPVAEGDLAGPLDRSGEWRPARFRRPMSTRVPSTPRAWIIASAQAVLCGPSRMATSAGATRRHARLR